MKKNICKKGMSLVELLVAMLIISMGMIGFTILASKAWGFKGYAIEQATATAGASRMVNKIVRELRTIRQADDGSYPIKEVSNYSLTVFRDDDNDNSVERVHYFVEDGKLKKGVAKFDGSSYPESENVSVLLNYITNEDLNQPFFIYYDNSFPVASNNPMGNPTPFDVRLIRVHLWINIKPIVAPENINIESFVELRNLNES